MKLFDEVITFRPEEIKERANLLSPAHYIFTHECYNENGTYAFVLNIKDVADYIENLETEIIKLREYSKELERELYG